MLVNETSLANSSKDIIYSSTGIPVCTSMDYPFSLYDFFISTTTQQDGKGRCEYTNVRCCN